MTCTFPIMIMGMILHYSDMLSLCNYWSTVNHGILNSIIMTVILLFNLSRLIHFAYLSSNAFMSQIKLSFSLKVCISWTNCIILYMCKFVVLYYIELFIFVLQIVLMLFFCMIMITTISAISIFMITLCESINKLSFFTA